MSGLSRKKALPIVSLALNQGSNRERMLKASYNLRLVRDVDQVNGKRLVESIRICNTMNNIFGFCSRC